MATPQLSTAVAGRPLRHLVNLWLVVALYTSLKGAIGNDGKVMTWVLALFGGLLLIVWRLGRRPGVQRLFEILLDERPASTSSVGDSRCADSVRVPLRWRNWIWVITGLALVGAALAFLEMRQPYFFSQDDNLSQFMPVVLAGCRSLFNDGIFSTWNPHQFLGSPTASLGVYALTYPPTYASYACARWLLGNEYAMLEVFCIGHLLAGYAAMYWAGRQLGLRASLAATIGICFAMSGFFLIAGRSWYYMTPTAFWAPILVGLLARLRRSRVGWKWMLATGGTIGALFHAGNAQMWCYAVLLYVGCLTIWCVSRAISWSQVVPAAAGLLLGTALAMPLLVPQFRETADLHRAAGDGILLPYLGSLFLPCPLAKASYPGVLETPNADHMGELYYAGTVFSIVAAIGMVSLLACRWNRRLWGANVWLPLAWIALLLALGRIGGLWYLLSKFPPFAGFEHPFKFVPFVSLLMLLGGGLLIERALRHSTRRRWEWIVCAAALACMAYHVGLALPSFCNYGFKPYPQLPAELQALRDDPEAGRIYAIGPRRSLAPEFGLSLRHQLPTVWGLNALGGYDPLVAEAPPFKAVLKRLYASETVLGMQLEVGASEMELSPQSMEIEARDPVRSVASVLSNPPGDEQEFWGHSDRIDAAHILTTLRTYAVRWIVVYCGPEQSKIVPAEDDFFWKQPRLYESLVRATAENCQLVVHRPEVRVYELDNPAPMAFVAADAKHSLPIRANGAGMVVDTAGLPQGGNIVVNVLATRYLRAYADGRFLESTPDPWGRLMYSLPLGVKQLKIVYRPPWLFGAVCGALLAACAVMLMSGWKRRKNDDERLLPNRWIRNLIPLGRAA